MSVVPHKLIVRPLSAKSISSSCDWGNAICSAMPTSACAILLDLDGTLIDSQPGILSSYRAAALRALGHVPELGSAASPARTLPDRA